MDKILSFVECSDAKDGERFATIIQKAIDEGKVTLLPSFSKTTTSKAHQKRIKEQQRREKEWDKKQQKNKKKKKEEENDDLLVLIQAKQKDRVSHLDALADKIAAKHKKQNGGNDIYNDDGPSEEEFQRIQAEMLKKRKRNTESSNGKEPKRSKK